MEDYITEVAADRLLQSSIKHMSLHFDGIRVLHDGSKVSMTARKEDLEQYVYAKSGYIIKFDLKKHQSFLQWAKKVGKPGAAKQRQLFSSEADNLSSLETAFRMLLPTCCRTRRRTWLCTV